MSHVEEHEHQCEHEHDHEHHCCGHHHEHEEGHHCCGHDHEHEHHHDCPINIHEHEGSIAVSFSKDFSGDANALKIFISSEMQNLEKLVKDEHGVVGHIKAAITLAKETQMLSLTKEIVNETKTDGGICRIDFAAIIIGVGEDILHDAVEAIYDKIQ